MSKWNGKVLRAALLLLLSMVGILLPWAQAQTFTVLHSFTGGADGSEPLAGLTMDRAGNLYGTTSGSEAYQNGGVFRLSKVSGGWLFTPLYQFKGGTDGSVPSAGVAIGADGSVYGTTYFGGDPNCQGGNCGTVFQLSPPLRICQRASCPWTKTRAFAFTNTSDGANPGGGSLVEDAQGNLYGTTSYGGSQNCITGCGVVFELIPSGGHWTEKVLYRFNGGTDGSGPYAGVTLDSPTLMFGTTNNGGDSSCYGGCGTIYQLALSGSTWTETVLYALHGPSPDGAYPSAGVIEDQAGNLFGAATTNAGGSGTAFELARLADGTPSNWAFSLLYNLPGAPGGGPMGDLAFDSHGNLYGASVSGGPNHQGAVFKLSPNGDGTWTYTSLHDFTGGSDGGSPWGNILVDAAGNIYGTTQQGGAHYRGTVWMITP